MSPRHLSFDCLLSNFNPTKIGERLLELKIPNLLVIESVELHSNYFSSCLGWKYTTCALEDLNFSIVLRFLRNWKNRYNTANWKKLRQTKYYGNKFYCLETANSWATKIIASRDLIRFVLAQKFGILAYEKSMLNLKC